MWKSSLELHDSTIGQIEQRGNDVVILFSEGYIHRSQGRPGWDAGTGWIQPAEMYIKDAMLPPTLPEFSDYILSGTLRVDDQRIGLLPLPFHVEGEIEFQAVLSEGGMVTIRGRGASILLLGEARYVEEVPGFDSTERDAKGLEGT